MNYGKVVPLLNAWRASPPAADSTVVYLRSCTSRRASLNAVRTTDAVPRLKNQAITTPRRRYCPWAAGGPPDASRRRDCVAGSRLGRSSSLTTSAMSWEKTIVFFLTTSLPPVSLSVQISEASKGTTRFFWVCRLVIRLCGSD